MAFLDIIQLLMRFARCRSQDWLFMIHHSAVAVLPENLVFGLYQMIGSDSKMAISRRVRLRILSPGTRLCAVPRDKGFALSPGTRLCAVPRDKGFALSPGTRLCGHSDRDFRYRDSRCPWGQPLKAWNVLARYHLLRLIYHSSSWLRLPTLLLSPFHFAFRLDTVFDMPSKRSAISEVASRRVRTKIDAAGDALPESTSIKERAEPFRLMTVKFPIADVTAQWSMGSNRDVDVKHVRQLCQLNEEHGLQRQDCAHRVRLLCHAEDVRAMCDHLGIDADPNDHSSDPPFFEGWSTLTSSSAELLAGAQSGYGIAKPEVPSW
jgi:hypothetical protein